MLIRGSKRFVPFLIPFLLLIFIVLRVYHERLVNWSFPGGIKNPFSVDTNSQHSGTVEGDVESIISDSPGGKDSGSGQTSKPSGQTQHPQTGHGFHREVFSVSTADKKYFPIRFGDQDAINPNIIPNPHLDDTWIIVAQQQRSDVKNTIWAAELVCDAVFKRGVLGCVKPPMILPIAATYGDKCEGELQHFTLNNGPHDARVFYGPRIPYSIYGSNSMFTCFGQWMVDFRGLVDWGFEIYFEKQFRRATDLQRPPPYGPIEKNWFVFWDKDEQIYAHYDIAPKRVFARLDFNGSAGPDLAPLAAASDEKCMAKYMPKVAEELESIHQATNSLSITLCKRSDPACEVEDSNTYILNVFQHKSYYSYHSVYEPYVMLFQQNPPFEVYGISTKPFWIHGRAEPADKKGGEKPKLKVQNERPSNQTEMFYVTSLSWKQKGQKYHGYVDDVLIIGFGIEDAATAGIDILAGDLLTDLGLCSDT